MFWLWLSLAVLLLVLALAGAALEGECSTASGRQSCSAGALRKTGLLAVLVASDGVRWQLAQVLPTRQLGEQLRAEAPVEDVALAPLQLAEEAGQHLLVLRTFQGKTRCFRGAPGKTAKELAGPGQLEDGTTPKVAAVSSMSSRDGKKALALGHHGGVASVWLFQEEIEPHWQRTALVNVAHHDWERVNRVVLSGDARFLLACSEDNVILWHLPNDSSEPKELHHLHGRDGQVSAADIAALPQNSGGGHLVALAMKSGGLQGWTAHAKGKELQVDVAWNIRRPSNALVVHIDIAASGTRSPVASGAPPPAAMLAMGDSAGSSAAWALGADGALLGAKALWERKPQAQHLRGLPVSGLQLLLGRPSALGIAAKGRDEAVSWLVAVAVEKEVVVLDGATGREIHKGNFRNTVAALSWA